MTRKIKESPQDEQPQGFSYQAWYESNREEFNDARRGRYAHDPAYRARVLTWNRESRRKKREAAEAEAQEAQKAQKVELNTRRFKTLQVTLGGQSTEVHSIGALALYLRRSIQVLRLWETAGVIPGPSYKTDKGDRFYTRERIVEIEQILRQTGRLEDQGGRQNQRFRPYTYRVRFADGTDKVLVLYKVGVLAQALHRTIVTVEQMETREALPGTPFRGSSTSYRLYTLDMIRAVKEAFDACRGDIRGEENRLLFRENIVTAWTQQGVMGAVLCEAVSVESSAA